MDKVILQEKIGGDGATATLSVGDGQLKLGINYPLDKVLSPFNAVIDKAIDGVEGLIPGDWDKAILEPLRVAAKAELVALLGQI